MITSSSFASSPVEVWNHIFCCSACGASQEAPASNSDKEELEELRQELGNSAAWEADLQVDRICVLTG